MNSERKNANVNHQDHPHQEGQQDNTPPIHHSDGQRRSSNNNMPMSNMKVESEEQKAGRSENKANKNSGNNK